MKTYSPKNARRDLAWLQSNRCVRGWREVDGEQGWFAVTMLDGREHELPVEEVRAFWLGCLSGWRAARTSIPVGAAVDSEVPA